jgi:DNA-binding CsgD family transcriptional regulator
VRREWPLIGRSEELQVIADATRDAGDRARGIVLSGAAGVGKTRLAQEAVYGTRGVRRRWIVGTASARGVPLGAFADIAASFGPDPLRRVREVIDGLLRDSQEHTVVVGVDDAHLLDDLSAFAVHQLVTRRLATVVLTIRSGESPPDAITTLWKDQHLKRLELQPLSLAETTRLVEHALDGPVHSLTARQLWQYTQGNVLYLHHLIDGEVDANRFTRRSGVWLWDGRPVLSPTLAELLEARIAQAPKAVREVLDALAVAEPLDIDTLAHITDPDAAVEAEALRLVRIDTGTHPATVRLAHPLFGDVRRTASLHMQRLRGRIATELGRKPTTDPRDLVRRALLTLESDLGSDPDLLIAAATAAMGLLDTRLAETLAERAVAAGGGFHAKFIQAVATIWQGRGTATEIILAELANQTSGVGRMAIASMRIPNFANILGQPGAAERELNEALPPDDDTARPIAIAGRALIDVARGRAASAVDNANALATSPNLNDLALTMSTWALVSGLGHLGRIDEIESAADRGYRAAGRSAEMSHGRFTLAFLHANAYRLAGALTTMDAVVARIRTDVLDVPFEDSWHAFLCAMSALSRGTLTEARRLLEETLAYLGTGDMGRLTKALCGSWLATVAGIAGRAADARHEFDAIEWWAQDPDACEWEPELSLAEAWVCTAEGATSQAISIAREAAAKECELGRPAYEVCLLETATRFGDHTTARRLNELAGQVQGPRAAAAAAHAAALSKGSGSGLVEASHQYQEFGDRLAAADAAAQAVVAYQNAGRRGAALTASAIAQRLADDCGGASTPALRAAAMPLPITTRQREIIALAAQGLSNIQIADRLTMSVRSVQSHIFRASQRVGVNSREQLIAILQGQ